MATAPVDDVVSSFRTLMLEDVDRAKSIFEGINEAVNDPVLSALAAMPVEDELTPEEMELEIAQAIKDSKSEKRISAEEAKREILG